MFQMIADVVLLCVYLYNIYTYIYMHIFHIFVHHMAFVCTHVNNNIWCTTATISCGFV